MARSAATAVAVWAAWTRPVPPASLPLAVGVVHVGPPMHPYPYSLARPHLTYRPITPPCLPPSLEQVYTCIHGGPPLRPRRGPQEPRGGGRAGAAHSFGQKACSCDQLRWGGAGISAAAPALWMEWIRVRQHGRPFG